MGTDSKMKVSASLIAIANAGTIDMFGAQRTTEMNTPEMPFCINCSDATLGQFPWQLSLQTTGHFCGGSILSATALSTAAHCRKSSYYAIAGTIDNQSGQKIQTNVFIGHPQYNGSMILLLVRLAHHSHLTHMLNQSHWLIHQALDQLMVIHFKHLDMDIIKWVLMDVQSLKYLVI